MPEVTTCGVTFGLSGANVTSGLSTSAAGCARMTVMKLARRKRTLGRVAAALITWAVVFTLTTMAVAAPESSLRPLLWPVVAWQLVYLAGLLGVTLLDLRHRTLDWLAFLTMLVSSLALAVIVPIDWLPIYSIVWVAVLPSFVRSHRVAYLILGGLVLTWYLIGRIVWDDPGALTQTLLFGTFMLFAMVSARELRATREARDEIAALNRELVGARHLLEETSRNAERTRIARDLHDMLGHHLTALSLNLQVAGRLAEGEAKEKVEHCHALARLLLSDVRDAVGELRDADGIDLATALRETVRNTPGLRVHLELPEPFTVDDVETARAILRCVQESLTNTLRHAGASNSWIRVQQDATRITVQIHDDGAVGGELQPGHGLTGMAERVAALRGELAFGRRGDALALTLTLPLAQAR